MTEVQFLDVSEEIQEDRRGLSFFPLKGRVPEAAEGLRSFHLVSINPGEVRGNHRHPAHAEWLYPFHGEGIFLWREAQGKLQERLLTGHSTLIYIPPNVAHAIWNPASEILYLLAWRAAMTLTEVDMETVPDPLRP